MTHDVDIKKKSEQLISQLAQLSESELSRLIVHHNEKYFKDHAPEISDEAFDKLVEALRILNPNAEALFQIGSDAAHVQQFGSEVVHRHPMLSLEKCYDDAAFLKWAEKISGDFVAMPKIDGVACSIVYSRDGKIVQAATRGDGRVGDDITKNAQLVFDVLTEISAENLHGVPIKGETLEVRGEIYLPLTTFKKIFAEDFVSPRNLAAGFLKLKDDTQKRNAHLRFFPYDVRGSDLKTEVEKFQLLERCGFSMMPWSRVNNDSAATKYYEEILRQRENLDYEVDGVVFRANSIRDQMRLGETGHHPKYAMAYKFQGESAQTTLVDVQWSVARSGIITPVALVKPVFVSGAHVSRASLHNLRIFKSLGLCEHSLVEITRRGGVIPHLDRVLSKKGAPLQIPTHCPACGGSVHEDGDFLICDRPDQCSEVVISRLIHFCSVLDIEGMGEKIVRNLVAHNLLRQFADVFKLRFEDLISLERMGEVSANKLLRNISAAQKIPLATFIRALGIHEIGGTVSEIIAANFENLETVRALTSDDLTPIHGIGERIAHAFVNGMAELKDEIDELTHVVHVFNHVHPPSDAADRSHPLFEKSVIFTGKMAHLDRKSAQEAVKQVGGKAPGALSKHVNYLVIGDEGSPLVGEGKKSTKHKQAEKLIDAGAEIKIISEREFLRLLGQQI